MLALSVLTFSILLRSTEIDMAYARKKAVRRRRVPRRRGTRLSGGRYTTRGSYRRTPTRRIRVKRGPAALPKYALANIDPFIEAAKGAKIPDTNTMPSTTFILNEESSMTLTLGNANAHCYTPVPGAMFINAGRKDVSVNTWWWGAADTDTTFAAGNQQPFTKSTSVNNQFALVRAVAHGIRVTCGLSPQTVTGFCHIAIQPWNTLDVGDGTVAPINRILPTSVSAMSECQWYRRVPLAALTQSPITVVNKVIDVTQQIYRSPRRAFVGEGSGDSAVTGNLLPTQGGIANTFSGSPSVDFDCAYGFANIIVAVEGAPSGSTPIVVESIVHYEGVPKSTGLQVGSTAAMSNPPVMAAVAHMAATADAAHTENTQESYMQNTIAAFQQGLTAGAGQYASAVGERVASAAYGLGTAAAHYAASRVGLYGSGYGPTQRLTSA